MKFLKEDGSPRHNVRDCDHGTALDIADDMSADFSSMKLALETALASLDEKK